MQLENSFAVGAPPDRVFAYLLDVNKIVGCVPGAEISEVVDPTTFKGKVKVKVGPITVAYSGTARIVNRNDADRSATLEAEGRETTGPGSARAKALMTVEAGVEGSVVKIVTDYSIAGRVAQFGRGVMEDVSRRIVNDMAACIKANLEAAGPGENTDEPGNSPGPAGNPTIASSPPAAASRPINAFGLLFSVLWARVTGQAGHDQVAMESLDSTTAGIGILLGLASLIALAIAAVVVATSINEIVKST
ncbi:MAG: SRPBCC family protein [Candidatus Dormibacteraeota bacterium]|nr:SRPBCC family protein [Candidatus Dormibacteraeota bacterium]